jgi:hypothetical protein
MILEEQNPGGLGVLPLLYAAAVAIPFAVGGLFTWLSVEEYDKKQAKAMDAERAEMARTGSGTIALQPPPAPAAPKTEAEMRGGWTPARQTEENAKLWKQYVAEAPSWVDWNPVFLPRDGVKPDDTLLYAGLAAAAIAALMLARG